MLITKAKMTFKENISNAEGRITGEIYQAIYEEMPCCQICGESMSVRDHILRGFIPMSGVQGKVKIRRLVCADTACSLHTRPQRDLPSGLVPRRQYTAEVHQAIAEGRRDVPCAPNTIHRIYAWLVGLAVCLLASDYFLTLCENVNEPGRPAGSPLEQLRDIIGGGKDWLCRAVEKALGQGGGLHCR